MIFFFSIGRANAKSIKTSENTTPPSPLKIIFNLKSLTPNPLSKIILAIIAYLFLNPFLLLAKENTLAFLDEIISNNTQIFYIKNQKILCTPYGIVTLEKLYKNAKPNSTCRKKISEFYKTNPNLISFAQQNMKIKQKYHIILKQKKCIIYVGSQITFSEMLLQNGLALKEPNFKDIEFEDDFFKAQKSAKFEKKGLWSEKILKSCIIELYKQ
jgi:Fe-S cluster assembly iron-binding protein IscA